MIFAADIKSDVTREECEALCAAAEDGVVLEMGSGEGRSTIALASVARLVHTVDMREGDELLKNIKRYGVSDRVIAHIGPFEKVVPSLVRGFDIVFIDGFVFLSAVKTDTNLAIDAIKPLSSVWPSGTLAFHGYGLKHIPGIPFMPVCVTEVVDKLACEIKRPVKVVGTLALLRLGV